MSGKKVLIGAKVVLCEYLEEAIRNYKFGIYANPFIEDCIEALYRIGAKSEAQGYENDFEKILSNPSIWKVYMFNKENCCIGEDIVKAHFEYEAIEKFKEKHNVYEYSGDYYMAIKEEEN